MITDLCIRLKRIQCSAPEFSRGYQSTGFILRNYC